MSKKVTSKCYNHFPNFIHLNFLEKGFFLQFQKLHNIVKTTQEILQVKAKNKGFDVTTEGQNWPFSS
jgi:hypothetical protein